MDEVFNELKEKINKYNELSRNTENLGLNNSEVAKVEEEIKSLKSKIAELNYLIEEKSKIEKMKITLNITSIESEITLKEISLEEEKKKAKKDYDNRIQSSNKNLEDTKKNRVRLLRSIIENEQFDDIFSGETYQIIGSYGVLIKNKNFSLLLRRLTIELLARKKFRTVLFIEKLKMNRVLRKIVFK